MWYTLAMSNAIDFISAYNTIDSKFFIKGICYIYRFLTYHGVYYQQNLVWFYLFFDVF